MTTKPSAQASRAEYTRRINRVLNNFAATLESGHRKTALGIAQVVMVAGLAVNQALDKVELKA